MEQQTGNWSVFFYKTLIYSLLQYYLISVVPDVVVHIAKSFNLLNIHTAIIQARVIKHREVGRLSRVQLERLSLCYNFIICHCQILIVSVL